MSMRSIRPRNSCSEPIGISVATTCEPNADFSDSNGRKKSARSRSSMFTNTSRARSSSAARCHSRAVLTSTPITALTTNTADSHTRRALRASATKLGSPGVSIRLILRPCHSNDASAAEIDICRCCSSSSPSETVVPSVTAPRRLVTPASNSSASCSEVLPVPRCPTSATLRIWSAGLCIGRPYLILGQLLLRQMGAQPQDRLGVQLGDPGLGDPQHLADLAQRQVLVVVEGDHQLLALGQAGDRVGHPVLELGRVHDLG